MDQKIRVTVLIENTTESSLVCEHGLSLFIEYNGKKILLDAGSSEAFWENAHALDIPLTGLDAYVLSHGHYDHSGGFGKILTNDPTAKIYARKEALDVYLSASGRIHEISVPQEIAAHRDRFILTDGVMEILPRVFLVPHQHGISNKSCRKVNLYKMRGEEVVPDDFMHEHSLVLDTEKGLVIFNSCSHGGAVNIIREAEDACGQKQVYSYVGGLHMKGTENGEEICTFSKSDIDDLCDIFLLKDVKRIYTGHCTGSVGFEELHSRLGNRIHKLTTGMQFDL